MIRVVEYITSEGKNHFGDWLTKIPTNHATRVTEALYRMALGNFGDHKSVGDGVMERRIFGKPALRIYYAMDGKEMVILLAGGGKNKQNKDIEKAKVLWAGYKTDN